MVYVFGAMVTTEYRSNMRTPQFMLHDAPKLLRERVSSYQTSQQGGDDAIIIREPLREETFDSVPSAINITDA